MNPLHEGISGARRVYGDEAAGPPLKKIRGGASLADLQSEYALFSYAPLFLFGGLTHNPVQEWINLNNHKQVVFILQLDRPIFHMGNLPIWDRTLWVVEKPFWPSLALHIGSIALLDRAKRTLTRVICQEVTVPDVAALDHMVSLDRMPTVTVSTFAVDSNLGCLAFAPANHLVNDRPYLKFHPPREETLKLAEALLSFKSNPYDGVQPLPWEKANEDSDPSAPAVGS